MKEEICRKIYRETFEDEDITFEDLLFKHCFKYCKFFEENGRPVSMFFALPCVLKKGDFERKAIYIYAAATDKNYRGKGYMGRLIEESKKNEELIFLRPAEDSLIDYYARFDFYVTESNNIDYEYEIIPIGGFKELCGKITEDTSREKFNLMYFSKTDLKFNNIKFLYSMN